MNHFKLTALALAASLALFPSLSFAQVPGAACLGGAYGPVCTGISPLTANLTGSYAKGLVSGTMAAGLAAGSPVYSFRYTGTGVAVIKRIVLSAGDVTTAFAATAATFQTFAARSFTASDTGGTAGTLTGNNGKLRTTMATTAVGDVRISSTATLTAGTRTLDTDPLSSVTTSTVATAGSSIINAALLDAKNAGDYPLVLANNEGFVIQATVPATGTWTFSVFVEWDEYTAY